jgi:hypothetical protein
MSKKALPSINLRNNFLKILFLVLLTLAAFIASKKYFSYDIDIFYRYSLNIIQGKVPYRDFSVEYPPLALLPIVFPQLLNSVLIGSYRGYELLFYIQNLLLIFFIGISVQAIVSDCRFKELSHYILLFYLLLILLVGRHVLVYFDSFPALLTMLALLATVKSRPSLCGVALACGAAAKLYPVILLPVFSLSYISKKRYSWLLKLLGAFFSTTLLLLSIFSPFGLNNVFRFLEYHKLRGLEIESIPAGILFLAHKLGWIKLHLESNYGAIHLNRSLLTERIIGLLPPIFLLFFLLAMISISMCLRIRENNDVNNIDISNYKILIIGIILAILIFIISNKVFSPQYLIWLLPFIPFLKRGQIALFAIICILTVLICPILFGELMNMELLPIILLNCRNALMILLTLWLILENFMNSGLSFCKSSSLTE